MGYAFCFSFSLSFLDDFQEAQGEMLIMQLYSRRNRHTFLGCITVSWQAIVEHEKPTNCNLTSGIKCLNIFLVLHLENHAGPFLFK